MKKLSLLFFIIFFSVFVSGAIDILNTPPDVKLGEILTVDGTISPVAEDVICNIRIYGLDSNSLVKRLTDEITSAGGHFSSDYLVITEPTFMRNSDYNIVVDCGTSRDSNTFQVIQRRNLVEFAENETLFLLDKGNVEVFYIWGTIGMFLFIIFSVFIFWWKKMRS